MAERHDKSVVKASKRGTATGTWSSQVACERRWEFHPHPRTCREVYLSCLKGVQDCDLPAQIYLAGEAGKNQGFWELRLLSRRLGTFQKWRIATLRNGSTRVIQFRYPMEAITLKRLAFHEKATLRESQWPTKNPPQLRSGPHIIT